MPWSVKMKIYLIITCGYVWKSRWGQTWGHCSGHITGDWWKWWKRYLDNGDTPASPRPPAPSGSGKKANGFNVQATRDNINILSIYLNLLINLRGVSKTLSNEREIVNLCTPIIHGISNIGIINFLWANRKNNKYLYQ